MLIIRGAMVKFNLIVSNIDWDSRRGGGGENESRGGALAPRPK